MKTKQEHKRGRIRRRKRNGLGYTLRRNDEALPNKHYSKHHKATEEDGTKKHVKDKSGEKMDRRFQVQKTEVGE